MNYHSTLTIASTTHRGVEFVIRRMSFAHRGELLRRVRQLGGKLDFLLGSKDAADQIEAALLGVEVDLIYLHWGLVEVRGLSVDGETATAAALASSGPEDLCREIVSVIRAECGLTEEERKN